VPKKPKLSPAMRSAFREYLREHLRVIGAKGGKIAAGAGAKKRYAAMTPAERTALAKKAAAARWKKKKKRKSS
jgi:hypothetical protein